MPLAAALPAIIAGGSSIASGILGSRAAGKASDIQSAAATQQADEFRKTLAQVNPALLKAYDDAAAGVTGAAQQGVSGITGATDTGVSGITGATQAGVGGITGATGAGVGKMDAATAAALAGFQPYQAAGTDALGTLRTLMAPGGDLTKTFTAADMAAYDPGYAFRMNEASKALQASAAARGGALGGGAAKALANYQQNLASSEYGSAFDRFMAQQKTRFDRLNTLVNMGANVAGKAADVGLSGAEVAAKLGLTGATSAGELGLRGMMGAGELGYRGATSAADIGLTGATTAGKFATTGPTLAAQNALETQKQIADLMTGGAAARAAGTVGSANAWGRTIGNLGQIGVGLANRYLGLDTLSTMQTPGSVIPNAPAPYDVNAAINMGNPALSYQIPPPTWD